VNEKQNHQVDVVQKLWGFCHVLRHDGIGYGEYIEQIIHISEIKELEFKLDGFKWLKDESLEDADELPEPEELATDAIAELESAVEELNAVMKLLEGENGEAAASRA